MSQRRGRRPKAPTKPIPKGPSPKPPGTGGIKPPKSPTIPLPPPDYTGPEWLPGTGGIKPDRYLQNTQLLPEFSYDQQMQQAMYANLMQQQLAEMQARNDFQAQTSPTQVPPMQPITAGTAQGISAPPKPGTPALPPRALNPMPNRRTPAPQIPRSPQMPRTPGPQRPRFL